MMFLSTIQEGRGNENKKRGDTNREKATWWSEKSRGKDIHSREIQIRTSLRVTREDIDKRRHISRRKTREEKMNIS